MKDVGGGREGERGFFNCRRPNILLQKLEVFSKIMVYPHGQEGLKQYGHFTDKGEGINFVRTSFKKVPWLSFTGSSSLDKRNDVTRKYLSKVDFMPRFLCKIVERIATGLKNAALILVGKYFCNNPGKNQLLKNLRIVYIFCQV